jgi:hypothetical protein
MADQDDDLLDYDDDSDAGQEAKIRAFQKKVKDYEKIILAPKQNSVEKRREAVRMLGELGEIESIPSLVRVYQKDKSPGMKEEAARALGMFKALEDALYSDDSERQEYAQTLVEGIVLHDAIGQRARMKRRPLQIALGGLFISFLVIFALGMSMAANKPPAPAVTETVVVANDGSPVPTIPTNTPIPTPSDVPGIVALLQIDYRDLSADTKAMRDEMLNSTREQPIDCTRVLKKPVAIVPPASFTQADVLAVVNTLNKARTDLAPVIQAYETACSSKQPIARADANTFDNTLVAIQTSLFQVQGQLSAFGLTPVAPVLPTVDPAITPTPVTPTVAPTATPTLDPSKFSRHFTGLRQIVSLMTGSNGYNTLLRQYWDDIIKSGSTGGCRNLPGPSIPQEYVLPEDVASVAPKDLKTAVDNLNTGLNLSRQSWSAFERFCADSSLVAIANQQYIAADTAQKAFEGVEALLVSADKQIKGTP